jgi:hypothetical protein
MFIYNIMNNKEDLNKYYNLVNSFIDDYVDTWKIRPSRLSKYLLNNKRLQKFLEKNGLTNLKKIDMVIKDVIDDRVAMEKDNVLKWESFMFKENLQHSDINVLLNGLSGSNIEHEKILANFYDTSLGHINILDKNSNKFKIDTFSGDIECVIYTQSEIDIITENIKESIKKEIESGLFIKVFGDIEIEVKEIIDDSKLESNLDYLIDYEQVIKIIQKEVGGNIKNKDNFLIIEI